MKKLFVLLSVLSILMACKSTKTVPVVPANVDRSSQSAIKGNWKIINVTFPGSDYIKVTSFQVADSKCFVGSTWNFIPNNNKGSFELNQSGCPAFSSPIVWSINKDGNFTLKIVDPGMKSKNVTQGYILRIANQTATSFQLIDNINVGGQTKEIVYQFEKIN